MPDVAPMVPAAEPCYVCNRAGEFACARCARSLCAEHRVSRSGIARNVFGPLFDDGKARCDDCYGARFWSAVLALVVIIGVVGALLSVASGRWAGVIGGVGIVLVLGGFAFLRMTVSDRRARLGGSRAGPCSRE